MASVDSSTPDPDPTNNTSTVPVPVPAQVDLAITKTFTGEFVVGQRGTYTLTVTNLGPTADPGQITVVDSLPAGLTPVDVTPGAGCTIADNRVECTLPGPLAVGATRTLTLAVEIGAAAAPSVVNTATVSTPSEDFDPSNDTDTVTTPVTPVANLTIRKELAGQAGDLATWAITVTNEGPNATTDPIVVTDTFPAELTYTSVAANGWECAVASGSVACTRTEPLAAGQSASLEIVTRVNAAAGAVITNVAVVEGGMPEQTPVDDRASLSVVPPTTPQLPFTPPSVPVGELPSAGSNSSPTLSIALVLLLLGGALLTLRRRA